LLFASGRPVVVASRTFESWFYWDTTLKPWVHYIPGGSSPESILRAVKWTVENPGRAEEIGRAGQAYAKEMLTYDCALKRYAKLLWQS
jgi:glycosyltransferase involved in cell wall biosynthesis